MNWVILLVFCYRWSLRQKGNVGKFKWMKGKMINYSFLQFCWRQGSFCNFLWSCLSPHQQLKTRKGQKGKLSNEWIFTWTDLKINELKKFYITFTFTIYDLLFCYFERGLFRTSKLPPKTCYRPRLQLKLNHDTNKVFVPGPTRVLQWTSHCATRIF